MRKIVLPATCLLLMFGLNLLVNTASADGKAFAGDRGSYRAIEQGGQSAFIVHENGMEMMLIAITLVLEGNEEGLVWIFPLPGRPEDIEVDILEIFPDWRGEYPRRELWDSIDIAKNLALATQIWPCVVGSLFFPMAIRNSSGSFRIERTASKYGISAELVTADTRRGLSQYLAGIGIEIEEEALSAYDYYFDKDFCFVTCRISSFVELKKHFPELERVRRASHEQFPTLYIEFPSEHIFYPMRPTSTYGDTYFPVEVRVAGYAKDTSPESYVRAVYQIQKELPDGMPEKMKSSFPDKHEIPYTRFSAQGPASTWTSDLYLEQCEPVFSQTLLGTYRLTRSDYFIIVLSVFSFVAASFLAGGLAGLAVFRRFYYFAFFGLFNLFTLIGLYIAIRLSAKFNRIVEEYIGKVHTSLKRVPKGSTYYSRGTAVATFFVVFSIVYVGVVGAIYIIEIALVNLI